jgi:hypothetical protein
MSSTGTQPPLSQSLTATYGPKLLGLVRRLETDSGGDVSPLIDEALTCLQTLAGLAARQSLLQNDITMAESLLLAASTNSNNNSHQNDKSTGSGKKRKAHGGARTLHMDEGNAATRTPLSTTLPIQLVMSAILRILGLPNVDKNPDVGLLVTLAADLVAAVAQRLLLLQQAGGSNTSTTHICVQAEYEWLQGSTKVLLGVLASCMQRLRAGLYQGQGDGVETRAALESCLWATCPLIHLSGTKLSRSTALLSSFREIGWDVIALNEPCLREASTALLATLPLAGGTDRATPASLWSRAFHDSHVLLWLLLQKVVPVSQRLQQLNAQMSDDSLRETALRTRLAQWLATLRTLESATERATFFRHLIQSVASLLVHLLAGSSLPLLEATLEVKAVLDVADVLLAFPMSAEASYYGTKKRLRDEALEGSGILSPSIIATELANHLYLLGQDILTKVLSQVQGGTLLPHARRLRQVGYAGLLTVCSPTLRQVLDPGYSVTSKRRRWLNTAVSLRTIAMRTMQAVVVTLGVPATTEGSMTRAPVEMDRVVKLACGCLLEQLYPRLDASEDNLSADWGSARERVELVAAAATCLSSILGSGGEFLTMETRQLMDSVAESCLLYIEQGSQTEFSTAVVYESFLELGKMCVSTSWPDGAASDLRQSLQTASGLPSISADCRLFQVALSARQLCDSLSHPTVPALQVVTRSNPSPDSNGAHTAIASAEVFTSKLDVAIEATKRQALRDRELAKEKKSKRTKTETKKVAPLEPGSNESESKPPAAGGHERKSPDKPTTSKIASAPEEQSAELLTKKIVSPPTAPVAKPSPSTSAAANVKIPVAPTTDERPAGPKTTGLKDDEESDLDEDFPEIVDCGPDEEDMEDE